MKIKGTKSFPFGYNSITEVDGKDADIMMDFGVLKLGNGTRYDDESKREKVFLLLHGKVELSWGKETKVIERKSFLDDDPITLDAPSGVTVSAVGLADESEILIVRTYNDKQFEPVLYEKCRIEHRGKGTMNEAGTRIVKTVMDYSITQSSNFMLGEDVQYPGKWAGFPAHHHEQPEIYFYRFDKPQGFGLVKLGDEGVLVENNDAVKIYPSTDHPQVAAPGYAMYFFWVIRHLENNPYIKPVFVKEHLWLDDPNAVIWPEKEAKSEG